MNMDKILKLLSFLKELPLGGKILSLIIVVLLLTILLFFCSCGSTTKAIIKNGADSTSTTVSISTNNPTNWQVTPDVQLIPKN